MRSRIASDGGGDLYEITRDSVPGGVDTAVTFESLWLKNDYDAIGGLLILDSTDNHAVNHAAFIDPLAQDDGYYNIYFQHWREKEAPVLNAVTRSGSDLTLHWSNAHAGRSIDSTVIFRNGDVLRTVGPADTSYVDSDLEPDIYWYSLKHVSWPAVISEEQIPLPLPNSESSNSITDTVPDPMSVTISGPDYLWTPRK